MRRNGRFYNVGVPVAPPAEKLAETIEKAFTAEPPILRHAVGFGVQAIAGRRAMCDEDFIALGAMVDSEYYQNLRDRLGLDLEPPERV